MITELKIDEKRRIAMLGSIDQFRMDIEEGKVKEFIILSSKGNEWITSYDFTTNFVTRSGAIFQCLLHASGVSFEKESE